MNTFHLSVEQKVKLQVFIDQPPTTIEGVEEITDYLNAITTEVKSEDADALDFGDLKLIEQVMTVHKTASEAFSGSNTRFAFAQAQLRSIHPYLALDVNKRKHIFTGAPAFSFRTAPVPTMGANLAHLSNQSLDELFESFAEEDEYCHFERVENKLSHRADVHAIMLLDYLCPQDESFTPAIKAGNGGAVLYLGFKIDVFKHIATKDIVRDLVRCGVCYSATDNMLSLIIENSIKKPQKGI